MRERGENVLAPCWLACVLASLVMGSGACQRGSKDGGNKDDAPAPSATTHDEAATSGAAGSPAAANESEFVEDGNPELARIYEEDQGDRRGAPDEIDWAAIGPRDEARRTRVLEILKEGGATSSADYFHAAMVFQHGSEPDDYQRAHELAVKAVELDDTNDTAKWLAAAAKDRYLMHTGKPQRYGTQFRKIDGTWKLYDVDPSVTDEERAQWNVPPLEEAQRRAAEMNSAAAP